MSLLSKTPQLGRSKPLGVLFPSLKPHQSPPSCTHTVFHSPLPPSLVCSPQNCCPLPTLPTPTRPSAPTPDPESLRPSASKLPRIFIELGPHCAHIWWSQGEVLCPLPTGKLPPHTHTGAFTSSGAAYRGTLQRTHCTSWRHRTGRHSTPGSPPRCPCCCPSCSLASGRQLHPSFSAGKRLQVEPQSLAMEPRLDQVSVSRWELRKAQPVPGGLAGGPCFGTPALRG